MREDKDKASKRERESACVLVWGGETWTQTDLEAKRQREREERDLVV